MVQEPARALETTDLVPREPVTVVVTLTHVLTRAYPHVVDQVKVVGLRDVTRGLGEHVAVHSRGRGASSYGCADHLGCGGWWNCGGDGEAVIHINSRLWTRDTIWTDLVVMTLLQQEADAHVTQTWIPGECMTFFCSKTKFLG